MKFFVCRLSFLRSMHKPLFEQTSDLEPIVLLEQLLQENLVFKPRRYGEGTVSLEFGDLMFSSNKGLIAGKLGKMKGIKKYNYENGRFGEERDVSHPYIYFFWDRYQQAIIIEKNSAVFADVEMLISSIERHFDNILSEYELSVKLVPITEKFDFWKVMEEYKVIYEVDFELFMPNFLGRTNEAVKDFLEPFKTDYNTSSVNLTLKSAEGCLRIRRDNFSLTKTVDWISKGGGKWSAVVKKSLSKYGKKSKINSLQNILYGDIAPNSDLKGEDEIMDLIQTLRPKYSVENDKDGEDDGYVR